MSRLLGARSGRRPALVQQAGDLQPEVLELERLDEAEIGPRVVHLLDVVLLGKRRDGQNLDRAEQAFKEYLSYEPGQDNQSLAAAHWRLGQLYERKNNKDLAKLEYEAALTLEPDHEAAIKALKKLK